MRRVVLFFIALLSSMSLRAELEATLNPAPLFGPNQYDNIARNMADISFFSDLPYVFKPSVKSQMAQYYYNNPKFVPIALSRGKRIFPEIEKQFKRIGIPEELKYVAVLESLLNSTARSKAGAVGLWQLMESTARDFNLHMGRHIDERKDVYKSTRAAGKFLKRLYVKYGDWFLALAAYNYGPGNINKILKRNPNATTFWDIQHLLPKETREYVPKFIAISYFMEFADDYNIQPITRSKAKAKKRKAVVAKRRVRSVAKLHAIPSGQVSSEIEEVPYCIRLFPIAVCHSLMNAEKEEQSPFDDSGLYLLSADLEAILKGSCEEESDGSVDPLEVNSCHDLDLESVLGIRKELTGLTGRSSIPS